MQSPPLFITLAFFFLLGSSCVPSLPSTRGQPCLTDADCWDLPCLTYVCGGFTSSESPPPDKDASGDIPPPPEEGTTEPPTEPPVEPDPPCQQGQQRSCYTTDKGCVGNSNNGYKCKGICQAGTQSCLSTQSWGPCQGEIPPQTEKCDNGKDDDCNGKIDDCPCPNFCQNDADCNVQACRRRTSCKKNRCVP